MIINNSRAKLFADCEKAFEFKFEYNGEGVEPIQKGRPLHFGTWMHKLLEAYFNGDDWLPVHLKLCKEFKHLTDEERLDCGDLPTVCREKMLAYERKWQEEDEEHEVLGTEIEIDVKIGKGHIMRVKVDMVTKNPLGIWLWEHKNHKKLPDTNYRFSDIQTARYVYAVAKGTPWGMPVGIMWDYIVSAPPTKPKLVKATKNVPARLSYQKVNTDLYTFVRAIKEYGLNPREYRDDIMRLRERDDFFQRIPVSISKRTVMTLVKDMQIIATRIERGEPRLRNTGNHCKWCDYQVPCLIQLMGGDWEGVLERSFKPRERGYSDSNEEEEEVIGR